MDQIILAVDDKGKFLEYISKKEGHKDKGRKHLAIAVLLMNSQGQVLLQKRKHKIFDNIWDITGATHPLHKSHPCHSERSEESSQTMEDLSLIVRDDKKCRFYRQDNIDETLEEATRRCLEEEWGIKDVTEIKTLRAFNYFAQYGDYCENEHCYLMVGEYNGAVKMDSKVGYEYKWMEKQDFLKDITLNPEKYTPWAIKSAQIFKNRNLLTSIKKRNIHNLLPDYNERRTTT